jgi:hypothetical protein
MRNATAGSASPAPGGNPSQVSARPSRTVKSSAPARSLSPTRPPRNSGTKSPVLTRARNHFSKTAIAHGWQENGSQIYVGATTGIARILARQLDGGVPPLNQCLFVTSQ